MTPSHGPTSQGSPFLSTIELMADNIGKVAISFLELAYLCGFLVVQAFLSRIGIHDLDMELLRLRYIQTGMLFLAFPLFVLLPFSIRLWIYYEERKSLGAYGAHKEHDSDRRASLKNFGHSRLSFVIQVLCVGICFYVYLILEPPFAFHRDLLGIAALLGLTILPGVLLPGYFGFHSKQENPVGRWLVACGTLAVLTTLMRGTGRPILALLTAGDSYWLLTFALCGYLFITVRQRNKPLFPGEDKGLAIARIGMVATLLFLSTYAFGYRLFPFIPVERGGGNYFYSEDAQLCFEDPSQSKPPQALPPELMVGPCSRPVKIIEASDSTLYIALPFDRGSNQQGNAAPPQDKRSGPEIWAEGEYFPEIYAVRRDRLSYFKYIRRQSK